MAKVLVDPSRDEVLSSLRELQRIDARSVAAIIADGVFTRGDRDIRYTLVDDLAERNGALPTLRLLGTERAGRDADDLSGAIDTVVHGFSEAGFLVGLAVGMALGSGHPFAGVTMSPAVVRDRVPATNRRRRSARKPSASRPAKRAGAR